GDTGRLRAGRRARHPAGRARTAGRGTRARDPGARPRRRGGRARGRSGTIARMTAWVALLRGINVGGNRKVPMARLRELCADAGLSDVRTYIASGNLVFSSPHRSSSQLEELVADLVEREHGF